MRTFVFFLYFWATVTVSSPLALALWILDSVGLRSARRVTGRLVRFWARSLIALLGIRVDVTGLDRLPGTGGLCFVSNHQGDFDIVLLLAYLPGCVGFITKGQAAWMPFLNIWICALGGVFINRDKVAQAHTALARGTARLRDGGSMAVFPEGTRSRGPRMGAFRNGSFKLATKAGAVVVPVSIQGTYRIWEENKRITPADIRMRVGAPIPTLGMAPEARKRLPESVRFRIEEGLREEA